MRAATHSYACHASSTCTTIARHLYAKPDLFSLAFFQSFTSFRSVKRKIPLPCHCRLMSLSFDVTVVWCHNSLAAYILCLDTHTHTYTHSRTHTHTLTHTHTDTHAHTHRHSRTHTQTLTHTHTCALPVDCRLPRQRETQKDEQRERDTQGRAEGLDLCFASGLSDPDGFVGLPFEVLHEHPVFHGQ